jgi:DNA polymerase-3 subunit delta
MKEIDDILTNLKRKIVKPVYYLYGEEPYYIDVISDYIEQHFLDESEKEFNQKVIYGKDIDLGTLLTYAKSFPMMGDYQVVILKEAQNIPEFSKADSGASIDGESDAKEKKDKNNSVAKAFISYLENPLPSTILVICQKYKKPDGRSAIFKAFQKHAVCVDSKKLYDNKIPDWINNYVKEIGYTIHPRAAQLLADYLGANLSKITNEISKLIISIPKGAEIKIEQIQENIGVSKEFNVFELQDALAKKDAYKANQIINYFIANPKENPFQLVISTLYGYFNKILLYHFIQDKNKFNVAKELAVNPFFAEGYIKAGQQYNTLKLKQIFHHLRECDAKSKGIDNYSLTYGELMKELIFKILH